MCLSSFEPRLSLVCCNWMNLTLREGAAEREVGYSSRKLKIVLCGKPYLEQYWLFFTMRGSWVFIQDRNSARSMCSEPCSYTRFEHRFSSFPRIGVTRGGNEPQFGVGVNSRQAAGVFGRSSIVGETMY